MEKQGSRTLFTRMESELLLELVRSKLDIIESKETNKVSVQQKTAAYEEIARQYNSNIGVNYRTAKQLKQKYQNLKKDANRLAALQRAEIRKTGGGIPVIENLSSIGESILSMGVVTKPLSTRFDSDASFLDYDDTDGEIPDVGECSMYEEEIFVSSFAGESSEAGPLESQTGLPGSEATCVLPTSHAALPGSQAGPQRSPSVPPTSHDGLPGSQAGPQRSPSVPPTSHAGLPGSQAGPQRSPSVPPTSYAGLPGSQARPSGSQTEVVSQPDTTRKHGVQAVPGSSQTPKVTAREALNMFRRGSSKKKPTETASSRAAQAILEETRQQMELKRKQDERDSLEHELRVKLLKTQIEVQEKILAVLNENPQDLNLNIKL